MKKKAAGVAAAVTLATGAVLVNGVGASATTAQAGAGWRSGPAAQAPVGDSTDITTGRTIRLRAHGVDSRVVNVGPSHFGPGDYYVFEETLRDRDSGQQVGRDAVQCTNNFTVSMCSGTFLITGKGTLTIAGALGRTNASLAVTGGTGLFQNARGQFIVGSGSGANTNLTFHLLP